MKPLVILRRNYINGNYHLWLGSIDHNGKHHVAKPIQLDTVPYNETFQLPDPTITIPYLQLEDWYKQMTRELSFEKDPIINNIDALKAKNENLNDLRTILNKILGITNETAK